MKNKEQILKELLSKAGKATFKKYGSEHYRNLQKKSVKIRRINNKNAKR